MTNAAAVEDVLFAALEKRSETERAAFLDSACAGDMELRRQIDKLLKAHDNVGDFLLQPVGERLVLTPEHLRDPYLPTVNVPGGANNDGAQHDGAVGVVGLPDVPGYRVLGEIARGGMGRVLVVYDLTLEREIALKVLLPGANPDRFVRESKISARLTHPGIPPIHELGTLADGSPFLAMKLITGQTLSVKIDIAERPRLLQVFTQVCQAVGFAHSMGVVHRDLKPANIMVGAFGEVQVMDWGLAKDLTSPDNLDEPRSSSDLVEPIFKAGPAETITLKAAGESTDEQTRAGTILGTPAYMAPEQARGEACDARSDVFALGGILCAILTGQAPYSGNSTVEVIRRARAADLAEAHARLDDCGADAELVALCRQCLSADPRDRPDDGQAVADGLTTYLNGVQERLQAAQRERAVALAREAEQRKRRKVQFALATTVVALLLGGGAFAWWQNEQVNARKAMNLRRQLEDEQRNAADHNRLGRNAEAVAAHLNQGEEALRAGDVPRAQVALEAARKRSAEGGAEQQAERLGRLDADLALLRGLDGIDQFRWTTVENQFPDNDVVVNRTREALARFGVDPEAASVEDAVARVSASAVRERIVSALDRFLLEEKTAGARALLRQLDAEPYRDAVRDAVVARNGTVLLGLAGQKPALEQPPGFAAFLGEIEVIPLERRRQLLRAAVGRRTTDVSLLMALGRSYSMFQGRSFSSVKREWADEQLRWYQAAVAVAPSNGAAHLNLGAVLCDEKRDYYGAILCFRKAIELDDKDAYAHSNLARALRLNGELDEAIVVGRRATVLAPTFAMAHNVHGSALLEKGEVDEAITYFRKSLDIDRKIADTHNSLGRALQRKNKLNEAIASYREAIALDPKYAFPHYNLGLVLLRKDKVDEAIDRFREALALGLNDVNVHFNLGVALIKKGEVDKAIACYRKAIEINPAYAKAHYELGTALLDLGRSGEGIVCLEKAVELEPTWAEAHCNLGHALTPQGRFAEALKAFQRGHELGKKQPDWVYPSAKWVRDAEAKVAVEAKLPAFLKGELKPGSNQERLAMAEVCRAKKFHHAAYRLYADAFAARPKLADDLDREYRFNAACCAALAGAGKGEDTAKLDDQERARLHKQAFEWFRADLTLRTRKLTNGDFVDRAEGLQNLKNWQTNRDLAGVRDKDALAKLPAEERALWEKLWADVAAVLKKAETPAPK
jgi:eukaryotic-like serine/threonine-protein kinase